MKPKRQSLNRTTGPAGKTSDSAHSRVAKETAFAHIDQCTKEALKQGTNVRQGCEEHTGIAFLPDP